MIIRSFYLSDESNLDEAARLTDLSADEIVEIVGRFGKHSWRHGQLRGEVVAMSNGRVVIRHHFTKKKLWESDLFLLKAVDDGF